MTNGTKKTWTRGPEGWGAERRKGGAPDGWEPKPRKGGAPEGWGTRRVGPPKIAGEPNISRAFVTLSPHNFLSFFPLLVVLSRGILVAFKNTTKIAREDTQREREKKNENGRREREKKERNFGRSGGGAVRGEGRSGVI